MLAQCDQRLEGKSVNQFSTSSATEASEETEMNSWEDVNSFIRVRVASYDLLERQCDSLLHQQDGIARGMYLGTSEVDGNQN